MKALYLILTVAGIPWTGFVISKLWLWFLVPLGIVPVGIWWACGIGTTLQALRGWSGMEKRFAIDTEHDDEKALSGAALDILMYGTALLFGWIYLQFAF